MKLSSKQITHLRGLAHHLKVVVTVGAAGVPPAVVTETSAALAAHELIKIKLPASAKKERLNMLNQLCDATDAILVQHIGRIGVIYKAAEKTKIPLP